MYVATVPVTLKMHGHVATSGLPFTFSITSFCTVYPAADLAIALMT